MNLQNVCYFDLHVFKTYPQNYENLIDTDYVWNHSSSIEYIHCTLVINPFWGRVGWVGIVPKPVGEVTIPSQTTL